MGQTSRARRRWSTRSSARVGALLAGLLAVAAGLAGPMPGAHAGVLAFVTAPQLPAMPTVTLNGQAQTATARMNPFSVSDVDVAPPGWNVTVNGDSSALKSPVFKQYCPVTLGCGSDPLGYVTSGQALAANSLTLNSSGVTFSGGTGSAPAMSCGGGCFVDSATAVKIATAPIGGGTGVWTTGTFGAASLSLATPSTLHALPASEVYHLDVVWTLSSGP